MINNYFNELGRNYLNATKRYARKRDFFQASEIPFMERLISPYDVIGCNRC